VGAGDAGDVLLRTDGAGPDGRTLASTGGTDNIVRLWDQASGEQLAVLEGHTFSAKSVAWSPDGRTLVSAGGTDNIVRLWGVPHN